MRPKPSVLWLARRALVAAVALATLLAGCALPGSSTPSPRAGAPLPAALVTSVTESPQSGAGFATLHLAALDPATGAARWTYQATFSPLRGRRSTVVAGGIVYVSSDALPATITPDSLPVGTLTALSERDGHALWSAHLGALGAEPVVSDGVVYVSGITSASAGRMVTSFYALRASDGQRVWRTDIAADNRAGAAPDQGFGVTDTLVVADGVVSVASNPSCFDSCGPAWLLALRASDGKRLWKRMVSDAGSLRAPVAGGGDLYTVVSDISATSGNPTSQVVAYSASDGAPRWSRPLSASGLLIVANGLLYVSSITQEEPPSSPSLTFTLRLNALDPTTGATRWSVTTSTGDTDSYLPLAAMTPGALYIQSITATGDTLTQLDPSSGAVRWRTPLPLLVGPMLVDGETLYAITSYIQRGGMTERTGSLVAYSASDGHALWSARLPSGGPSGGAPLARVGGVIIAAYLGSAIEAYGAQGDHHQVWSATIPGALIGLSVVE